MTTFDFISYIFANFIVICVLLVLFYCGSSFFGEIKFYLKNGFDFSKISSNNIPMSKEIINYYYYIKPGFIRISLSVSYMLGFLVLSAMYISRLM